MAAIKNLKSGSMPSTKDSNPTLPSVTLDWNFQNTAAPTSTMYANATHQVITQGKTIKKPGQ